MGTTIVTRNYQITLPKDIRELEDIKIGDSLLVNVKDDVIELKKLSKEKLMKCAGAWKKIKEDSIGFVRRARKETEDRMNKLGL